jgi:hypothetical protein
MHSKVSVAGMKFIRRLLRSPDPVVSAEQAVMIAKNECMNHGWRWGQPIVSEGIFAWHIWADCSTKPSAFVVIDQRTGKVERSGCGIR